MKAGGIDLCRWGRNLQKSEGNQVPDVCQYLQIRGDYKGRKGEFFKINRLFSTASLS